ncbi:MAG: asparagine synthase (glutamine-hydrolyzing) [Anaerolineae bacterium]
MCGIVGTYNFSGQPANPSVVREMMALQAHRGPDDQGLRLFTLHKGGSAYSVAVEQDFAGFQRGFEGCLGFNRLSILDLSYAGHQPMVNPEGTVMLAFNGEIYNAFDFRDELISLGYHFRSRTDTEVLLYLYQQYGLSGMLARINGMFAIVICDLAQGRMHLVRDRVGIKPLYYYKNDDFILFASEVKSFLAHPNFHAELDERYLDEYLLFRYCTGDRHLLKNVKAVPPGHILTISPDEYHLSQYWDYPISESNPWISRDTVVFQLESALRSSVKRQLQSDVILGCQLSGGIDSSLVAMIASQEAGTCLHAISILLEDPRYSEEPYIDRVHSRFQIDCHKYMLDEQFFLENLSEGTWHLDQPLNHPNSLGIFLLAQRARDWMTVLLSGEGADELLGGYPRYAYADGRYRSIARFVSPFVEKMPRYVRDRFATRFGQNLRLDKVDWFILSTAFISGGMLHQLRPEVDISEVLEYRRTLFDNSGGDFVKNCMRYDLKTYMVDLLVRQDKMTMAHSIENRVPFLDNEMLDLWGKLPSKHLIKPSVILERFATKMPLKQIAKKYFGADFAYRRKMGFGIPLRTFFSAPLFEEMMEDLILPGVRTRGMFSSEAFESWWRRLSFSPPMEVEAFWIFVAFELWCHLFIDGHWTSQYPTTQNQGFVAQI